MIALRNVALGNGYTDAATRDQRGTVRIDVTVLNAAAIMQLADDSGNFVAFDEEFLPIGGYSFNRACGGARFRNAVAGSVAQVSATLLQRPDVP